MSLEINQREREGIVVLDLKGRITAGEEATTFRDAAEKVSSGPNSKLILNMEQVDYVDSTGLGAMVMCMRRAAHSNGVTKLLNVNRRNLELLVITRLDTFFEVFDNELDAVNSFFPEREIKRFDILEFVQNMQDE